MGDKSKIDWTDATWNPIVGCSIISPACTNCYAMAQAARIEAMRVGSWRKQLSPDTPVPDGPYTGLTQPSNAGAVWTGKVALAFAQVTGVAEPLRWRRPRKIFVNSMGDLFHESVPDEWIDRVFA
ncbi:Phage protein Gp37/Gp68, partial [Rhodoblastus acidophilus]